MEELNLSENDVLKQVLVKLKLTLAALGEKNTISRQSLSDFERQKCENEIKLLKLTEMKNDLEDRISNVSKVTQNEFHTLDNFKKEKESLIKSVPRVRKMYHSLVHLKTAVAASKSREEKSKFFLEQASLKESEHRCAYREAVTAYSCAYEEYNKTLNESMKGMQERWKQILNHVEDTEQACEALSSSTAPQNYNL